MVLAVIYVDSCGNSTSRRLQAKAVPAESVHKKTANNDGDSVDSLSDYFTVNRIEVVFIAKYTVKYTI